MSFITIVNTFWFTVFVLIPMIEQLSIKPSTVKRQIRFTKFELIFVNKSSATIMENSLRDYNQQQGIYFRIIMHDSITQLNIKISVSCCKEQYVDCVNIVSYDVHDICSKLSIFLYFTPKSNQGIKQCPITGEYIYDSTTFDAEKFVTLFSLPSDWWQKHWRIDGSSTTHNNELYARYRLEFFALQYRSRT